ncbi:MAG: SDR family oxidoreductase [Chloroflexi bacterium]|nr:SDR family oxidoreductase [Chloroflexota bacterium]
MNNTGTFASGPILDLAEDEWNRVMDTDLKSCYLCCQAVGKRMVEQKRGDIINIASTHAIKIAAERGAYAIAKAGVMVLTRVLARELAKYNIRVNAIAPGLARTRMIEFLWRNPELLKFWEAQIPLGRLGETSDIAKVALFLASDLAGYVTGQTIAVDGEFVA